MTAKERRKLLLMALQMSGLTNPLSQLVEAAAELIIAVQHVNQKRDGYVNDLAGQIADVELLLEQLHLTATSLGERVDGLKALKLERLKEHPGLCVREN